MRIKILGTGSSGNCYSIGNDKEQLIIEAGIPYKSFLKGNDYDTTKIQGVIISHSHG